MILDTLAQSDRYHALHPGFAAAFDYLRRQPLAELAAGKHDIDGQRLFVLIGRSAGWGRAGAKLEAHRRYIDIQYVVAGDEEIGWRPTADCHSRVEAFDEARDLVFFTDPPVSWFCVPPASFAVFFPDDAHAPLAGQGEIVKAVVKIRVDW